MCNQFGPKSKDLPLQTSGLPTDAMGPNIVELKEGKDSECLRKAFEDYLCLLETTALVIRDKNPTVSPEESACRAVCRLGAYVLKDAKCVWTHLTAIYGQPKSTSSPIRWDRTNHLNRRQISGNVDTARLIDQGSRIRQEWQDFAKSMAQLDTPKQLEQHRPALITWTGEQAIRSTIMRVFRKSNSVPKPGN